mmetsp:Transcript_59071/g.69052  ORF Transcript_59071/g.69052 Transcript_59071/m.69052 type:complete len:85 (-) Transcript_59071:691-945(-)
MGAGPISLIVTPGFEHQQLLHHSSNDTIASFLTDVAKLVSADQKETSPSSVSSMEIDKTPTHSSSSISLTHEAQSLVRLLFHSS